MRKSTFPRTILEHLAKNYPNLVPHFSKLPPNRGQQITLLSKMSRIRKKPLVRTAHEVSEAVL